jgi:hypothetical protein
MILETRLPTPADIIRVPQPNALNSVSSISPIQPKFPSNMLSEDLDHSSPSNTWNSMFAWILIVAGVGVAGTLVYRYYKRQKESKMTVEGSPKSLKNGLC